MTSPFTVCEVSMELKNLLRDFRFRKTGNDVDALIMKVDKETREIVLEEEMENTTIESITSALPSHQPRYVLLTYKLTLEDKRTSFPLVFVFISPRDGNTQLQMMYAGSKLALQREADCGGRVFELRELEEFDEEWLRGCLVK